MGFPIKPDRWFPHKLRTITRPDVNDAIYGERLLDLTEKGRMEEQTIISGKMRAPLDKVASKTWVQERAAFVHMARDENDNGDFLDRKGRCT